MRQKSLGVVRWLGVLLLVMAQGTAYSADYYWVGGSGDWSDINHWATTSGGWVTHFTVPSPSDDVYFDANSFTGPGQSVNMNLNIITCDDFDCTQAPYLPKFVSSPSTKVEIYGSMLLRPEIIYLINSELHFQSQTAGNEIRTAGQILMRNIYFSGPGGGWILSDTLFAYSNEIHLKEGNLNTNGQTIYCSQFNSNYAFTRSLNLSNSHLYIAATWTSNTTNLTVFAGSSRIHLLSPGASFMSTGPGTIGFHNLYFTALTGSAVLNAGAISFNRVVFSSAGVLGGTNTYGDLILTNSKRYLFTTSSMHIFLDSLKAVGHCLSPIRFECIQGTAGFSKSIQTKGNCLRRDTTITLG